MFIHPGNFIILLSILLAAAVAALVVMRRRPKHAGESSELTELRNRLAVLERIAVEKENTLEREIEALRAR